MTSGDPKFVAYCQDRRAEFGGGSLEIKYAKDEQKLERIIWHTAEGEDFDLRGLLPPLEIITITNVAHAFCPECGRSASLVIVEKSQTFCRNSCRREYKRKHGEEGLADAEMKAKEMARRWHALSLSSRSLHDLKKLWGDPEEAFKTPPPPGPVRTPDADRRDEQ
jgi:hypothetical protein